MVGGCDGHMGASPGGGGGRFGGGGRVVPRVGVGLRVGQPRGGVEPAGLNRGAREGGRRGAPGEGEEQEGGARHAGSGRHTSGSTSARSAAFSP